MRTTHTRHRQLFWSFVTIGVLVLSGCSSSDQQSSKKGGNGGALTIGVTGDTFSLNPQNCAPIIYCNPAYDALIAQKADGSFGPDLATEWKFTDDTHTTLSLTLRSDAKFSDGSALTASSVVASLNAFRNTPGPGAANAQPVDDVKAADTKTVSIHYSTPVTLAYAEWQLTVQNGFGTIIGPKGAANPKTLETASDGIGPYKLDHSQTTKGVQYTYVPNKQYFNKSAAKFAKVVLKPMQNPASRLSAVQSGQIDWAQGIPQGDINAAKSAGLTVSEGKLGASPAGMPMLVLAKRSSGPLSDQRVRQAISYAVPRSDITKALYGDAATPTSSLVPEGAEGYSADESNRYPYDVSKAKDLLAQAGYADGMDLEIYDPSFFDPGNALGQAMKSSLEKVGIRVKLDATDAAPGDVVQSIGAGRHEAFMWNPGASGISSLALVNFNPGGYMNPFKVAPDSKLESLLKTAAQSDKASDQDKGMQAVTARLNELEWAVPVATVPTFQATNKKVQGVPKTYYTRDLNPFSSTTSDNWRF